MTPPNGHEVDASLHALVYRLHRLGGDAKRACVTQDRPVMREFKQPSTGFSLYDPGVPRGVPDTSTPARRTAVAVEDEIRRDDQETGVFIAADGRELLRRRGAPDRVAFTASELGGMQGATFTHNHPGNMPFSVEDVMTSAFLKLAETRVVTSQLRASISRLDGVWEGAIRPTFDAEWPGAMRDAQTQFMRGDIAGSDLARHAMHLAWLRVSNRLGFKYELERS
jgi:hypothetical protein